MLLTSTLFLGLMAFQANGYMVGPRPERRQVEFPPAADDTIGADDPIIAQPGVQGPECENGTFQDMRAMLDDPSIQWNPNTVVSFPDEDDLTFLNATIRWSSYAAPTYVAAVSPANEEDVSLAVRTARQNNINFLATGGRHGYITTYGRLRNGLAIDLSQLNSIDLDAEAATVTIGGGTIARYVAQAVAEAGFEVPVGGCSCPGMLGVTLAGGITNWVGTRGMLMDSLLHVRMVTATGEIVEASESINPELFWGVRGAGQNFGIIVSATYRIYPQEPDMLMIETAWPAAMVEDYYHALELVLQANNPRLSANSIVNWDFQNNETHVFGHFTYMGDHDEGYALMAPILDLNPPMFNNYSVPFGRYQALTLFQLDEVNCAPGGIHNPYGVLTRTVDQPTLLKTFWRMDGLFREYPSARMSSLIFHSYRPDASMAIHDDTTAFAWRDALNYMYVLLTWDQEDTEAGFASIRAASECRQDFVQTSGYDSQAVYMNFAQGDETIEQVYSERKLPRLSALKATWDPDNVFRWHFPLPTSYP